MSFYAEPVFFVFLIAAIIPAAILGLLEKPIRQYGLVVSCLFLLLLFSSNLQGFIAFVFFLMVTTLATFLLLRTWGRGRKSKAAFYFAIAIVLLPLVVTKVGEVFDSNLLGFIGISYITFKAIQILLEIRDGIIKELRPFDFLYFLLFFPPFTSGPIDRSRRFTEDAHRNLARDEYADLLAKGIFLLLAGATYKLVFSALIFPYYTPAPFGDAFILKELIIAIKDSYAYGFYLFFDFAGYSMMAVGASFCLGIATPKNFNAPFKSLDIKDFWNRWHMTLSFWLRDYIFMRFAKLSAKKHWFKSRLTTACCGYIINMMTMGVWHGLTIDYIAYGLYHGLLLAGTDIFQKKSKLYKKYGAKKAYKFVSWVITINLVMFGFSLFSGQAHMIIGGLLHGS